jgi:replicative superfamily II helicase
VTSGAETPREMQLRAAVADQNGDSLTSAGTGSGKTLPVALNCLLDDPSMELVTLTISPLKRLQSTQTDHFSKKYNVPTLTINENTPRDDAWWDVRSLIFCFQHTHVHVYSGKCLQSQDR